MSNGFFTKKCTCNFFRYPVARILIYGYIDVWNYTFISLLSKRKKKRFCWNKKLENVCACFHFLHSSKCLSKSYIDASILFVENQSNLIRNVLCLNFSKTRNNYKENDVKSITKLNNKRNSITGRLHYHHYR